MILQLIEVLRSGEMTTADCLLYTNAACRSMCERLKRTKIHARHKLPAIRLSVDTSIICVATIFDHAAPPRSAEDTGRCWTVCWVTVLSSPAAAAPAAAVADTMDGWSDARGLLRACRRSLCKAGRTNALMWIIYVHCDQSVHGQTQTSVGDITQHQTILSPLFSTLWFCC